MTRANKPGDLRDRLVLDLYAAALDGRSLEQPLAAIARALGADMLTAHRLDTEQLALPPEPLAYVNIPGEMIATYAAHWAAEDPWVAAWPERRSGVFNMTALVPPEALRRTAFWNDFLRPFVPTVHGLALAMHDERHGTAFFNAWRGEAGAVFGAPEAALLASLAPDIERALLAAPRLRAAAAREAALDSLRDGVAVFDGTGRLRMVNAALEAMAASGTGLALAPGRLVLRDQAAQRAIEQAVALAILAARGGALPRQGSTIAIKRPGGATPWRAEVMPLARGNAARGTADGGAVVTIGAVAESDAGSTDILARRFGLTESEAALAAALAAGHSLADHARRHRISVATARTHLARIFAKTGCHRQAELVALLAPLLR